jgi:hypothetical protein
MRGFGSAPAGVRDLIVETAGCERGDMGQQVALPCGKRSTPARATSLSPSRPTEHASSRVSFHTDKGHQRGRVHHNVGVARLPITNSVQNRAAVYCRPLVFLTRPTASCGHRPAGKNTPQDARKAVLCEPPGRKYCHPCSGPKNPDMHLACQFSLGVERGRSPVVRCQWTAHIGDALPISGMRPTKNCWLLIATGDRSPEVEGGRIQCRSLGRIVRSS